MRSASLCHQRPKVLCTTSATELAAVSHYRTLPCLYGRRLTFAHTCRHLKTPESLAWSELAPTYFRNQKYSCSWLRSPSRQAAINSWDRPTIPRAFRRGLSRFWAVCRSLNPSSMKLPRHSGGLGSPSTETSKIVCFWLVKRFAAR